MKAQRRYKNDNLDERYSDLKSKVESKVATKKEYEEYESFKNRAKIEKNIPKVDKLKEYISKLESNLETLLEEYRTIENQGNLDTNVEKLMNRQEEIIAEKKTKKRELTNIIEKLKDKKLKEEEKKNLNEQKSKLENEINALDGEYASNRKSIDTNNEKFAKNEALGNNPNLSQYSKEELRAEIARTHANLSKSRMAANILMNGGNLDDIKMNLEKMKDKKFTSAKLTKLLHNKQKSKERENVTTLQQGNGSGKDEYEDIYSDSSNYESHDLPDTTSEFEKEFPRLSKHMPKFLEGTFVERFLLKVKKALKEDEIEDGEPEGSDATEVIEASKDKKEDFKKLYRVDDFKLEQHVMTNEDRQKILAESEKLKKAKEEAIKRQNKKFADPKNPNAKSYSQKSGDER